MILAAHQPQFMPWLGYFEKMASCDVFVILDDVQFKKNEWQNRNRIWTAQGAQWLTVPVLHRFGQAIREVEVNNTAPWEEKQLKTLHQSYAKAKFFQEKFGPWEKMYRRQWERLVDINMYSIEQLRSDLEVATPIQLSSQLAVEGKATQRLINLCKKLGADAYLAGAGARDYMDIGLFEGAGIKVAYQDYRHPTYPQFNGQFISHLSAMDLVLHCGGDAGKIMRGKT